MGILRKFWGETFKSLEEKVESVKKVLLGMVAQAQAIANNFVREVEGVAVRLKFSFDGQSFCTGSGDVQEINISIPDEWVNWYSVPYIKYQLIPMLIIHECGHARFTDEWFKQSIMDMVKQWEEAAALKGLALPKQLLIQIAHSIVNSVEDGRIERIDACRFDGFDETRVTHRGNIWREGEYAPVSENPKFDKVYSVCNNILTLSTTFLEPTGNVGLGMYQKGAQKFFKAYPDCYDIVKACKPHIVKAINGEKCEDIYDPCIEIAQLIYPLIEDAVAITEAELEQLKKLFKNMLEQMQDAGGEGGNAGKMQSDEEKEETQKRITQKTSSESQPSTDSQDADEESENGNASGEGEDDSSKDESKDMSENVSESEYDSKLTAYECDGECQAQEQEAKAQKQGKKMKRSDEAIAGALQDLQQGVAKHNKFEFSEHHQSLQNSRPIHPEKLLEAKVFKRFMDNVVRNKSVPNRMNLKRGKLNTHQISKICMGQYNCFKQNGKPYEASMAAFILKDNSGSMDGEKHDQSCLACSVLEYGMSDHPVKIVAFDSRGREARHIVLKDWGEKSNTVNYSETFRVNNDVGNGNMDGADILVAAEELSNRPERDKLLIVLSDGMPSTYNDERDAYGSVAYAVKEAKKRGIKVVAIFFGDSDYVSESQQAYAAMYGKDIVGVEPSRISAELQKVMKKQFR